MSTMQSFAIVSNYEQPIQVLIFFYLKLSHGLVYLRQLKTLQIYDPSKKGYALVYREKYQVLAYILHHFEYCVHDIYYQIEVIFL